MTTEKVSGKSGQLRSLLMRAWRERWTASQYATQVKAVVGRGVSGDVYGLADCLLQQALTGRYPDLALKVLKYFQSDATPDLLCHKAPAQGIQSPVLGVFLAFYWFFMA